MNFIIISLSILEVTSKLALKWTENDAVDMHRDIQCMNIGGKSIASKVLKRKLH